MPPLPIKPLAALCVALLVASNSYAGVSDLKSPLVRKGKLELEYSADTSFDDRDSKNHDSSQEFELEYGLTKRMRISLAGGIADAPGEGARYEATKIGSSFQLFEAGKYWLDSGLAFGYEHAASRNDADTISGRVLLQRTSGTFVHLVNYRLQQEIGSHASGGPAQRLQWNSRYLYSRAFEPGLELQSDFGKTSDSLGFDQQGHYLGPSLGGRFATNWKYEVAAYRGLSDEAADYATRVKLEYEIYF